MPALTVIVPLLGWPVVFSLTLKVMLDGKVPTAVPELLTILIHGVFVEALQLTWQPWSDVVNAKPPVPADDDTFCTVEENNRKQSVA
jgi:hypothetical protein